MTKRRAAGVSVFLAAMVLAAMVLGSVLPGCAKSSNAWQNRGGPPRIVVTIPPLDCFVRNVAGKDAAIICLCAEKGPHHYEVLPQDAMILREADLFFAVGLTLDDKFADRMQVESRNPRLHYFKLGEDEKRFPDKLKLKSEEEHEHGEAEHGHDHGEYDPHIWLGIPQAVAMVEIIRDELKNVDPGRAGDYDKNADAYIKKLKDLQRDGKAKLKDKKNRKIIAFHESLAYFAKSFDLTIVDAVEVAPGQEPSPAHLKDLVEKARKEDVRVLAVEPQYPKASAEVLQKEVKGLKLVVVDPLETAEVNDMKEDHKELKSVEWYERKMRRNLAELAENLP